MPTGEASCIEVYELDPRGDRAGTAYNPNAIGRLPADAPLPLPGDIIMLPSAASATDGAAGRPALEALMPYEVLRREYVYAPRWSDRGNGKPLRYLTTWLFVQRVGTEERPRSGPSRETTSA